MRSERFSIKQQIHRGQFRCALKTGHRNLVHVGLLEGIIAKGKEGNPPIVTNKNHSEGLVNVCHHIVSSTISGITF